MKTKSLENAIKKICWQASIKEQRPKFKIRININGLVDIGEDVTVMPPESWHSNWTLQEANVWLLGIGIISQVKQNKR